MGLFKEEHQRDDLLWTFDSGEHQSRRRDTLLGARFQQQRFRKSFGHSRAAADGTRRCEAEFSGAVGATAALAKAAFGPPLTPGQGASRAGAAAVAIPAPCTAPEQSFTVAETHFPLGVFHFFLTYQVILVSARWEGPWLGQFLSPLTLPNEECSGALGFHFSRCPHH